MEPLSYWIDEGARLCGSQNKLAEKLRLSSGSLSMMRSGKTSMPREACETLGELCGFDGAAYYEAQRATRRRQSVERQARSMGLLSLVAIAVIAGALSTLPSDARAAQRIDLIGNSAQSELQLPTKHYRGLRGVLRALRRLLRALQSSVRAWLVVGRLGRMRPC